MIQQLEKLEKQKRRLNMLSAKFRQFGWQMETGGDCYVCYVGKRRSHTLRVYDYDDSYSVVILRQDTILVQESGIVMSDNLITLLRREIACLNLKR